MTLARNFLGRGSEPTLAYAGRDMAYGRQAAALQYRGGDVVLARGMRATVLAASPAGKQYLVTLPTGSTWLKAEEISPL